MSIADNARKILAELPASVTLVAAAKGRSVREIEEAVSAGVEVIGENYVQEAAFHRAVLGGSVRWHCIGHLQRNKARQAVDVFEMVQTLDSVRLAEALSGVCVRRGMSLPVLVEINSGREPHKSGIFPEDAEDFLRAVCGLPGLTIEGLMTMGPLTDDAEGARPYFALTADLFRRFSRLSLPGLQMKHLSMGMSGSWKVAVEEGATMVRIGTALFGPRQSPGKEDE